MEIRRLRKGEEQEAYALADAVFREEEQKSMGEAFPSIFLPAFIGHSYGGFVDGKLVVFFGLVPSVVRIEEARVNIYSLGSVCTHPDFRGKGFAAAVLDQILEDLKQTEASLLLVSGDRSLYTRVGCRLFGKIHMYTISELTPSENPSCTLREMIELDLHAMARLTRERAISYEQSLQELAMMVQAEAYASCFQLKHKVLVAEDHSGEVSAFLVAGIPIDKKKQSTGLGIEWAGDGAQIVQLAQAVRQREGLTHLSLPVPWQDSLLKQALHSFAEEESQNQGTVLITNPTQFINQIRPYYKKKMGCQTFELMESGQGRSRLHFQINKQVVEISCEDLIAFFFNPDSQIKDWGISPLPFPYTAGLNYI